jgi:hypothetical protein
VGLPDPSNENFEELYPNEEPEILQLLKNNRQWVQDSQNSDPEFFKRIGGKQKPQYLSVDHAPSSHL